MAEGSNAETSDFENMKTVALIIGILGTLALLAIIVANFIRLESKWWRCSWCKCVFNANGEVWYNDLPPLCDGVVGDGCCPSCQADLIAIAKAIEIQKSDAEHLRGSHQNANVNAAYSQGGITGQLGDK